MPNRDCRYPGNETEGKGPPFSRGKSCAIGMASMHSKDMKKQIRHSGEFG